MTEREVLLCQTGCEVSPPPHLCLHRSPSWLSLCQQLLITPRRGVGHARVSFGSPLCSPPRPLLPNLPDSGDRNELPTTIGAATV